jgi:hypothetical protein
MAATSSQTSHIAKYDGQNYSLWKLGLWVLLEEHNLIDIVTGEDTLPDEVLVAIMHNCIILIVITYCTALIIYYPVAIIYCTLLILIYVSIGNG